MAETAAIQCRHFRCNVWRLGSIPRVLIIVATWIHLPTDCFLSETFAWSYFAKTLCKHYICALFMFTVKWRTSELVQGSVQIRRSKCEIHKFNIRCRYVKNSPSAAAGLWQRATDPVTCDRRIGNIWPVARRTGRSSILMRLPRRASTHFLQTLRIGRKFHPLLFWIRWYNSG